MTIVTITNGFCHTRFALLPLTDSGHQQLLQVPNFEPLEAANAESNKDEEDDMRYIGHNLAPETPHLFQNDSELSDFVDFR